MQKNKLTFRGDSCNVASVAHPELESGTPIFMLDYNNSPYVCWDGT